jgi:hypothetical protein
MVTKRPRTIQKDAAARKANEARSAKTVGHVSPDSYQQRGRRRKKRKETRVCCLTG